MSIKLKIKAGKMLSCADPTGEAYWDLIDVEEWETTQVHRYKSRVVWMNDQTGEICIVEMNDEDAHPTGKTGGLTSARTRMQKTGRPCGGGRNWEKADYKEAFRDEIMNRRAKGLEPEFPPDPETEDAGGEE